ncbi:MAG: malectin domain-containing carbohydrate-binding protein [Anaerolineae bacterium]
MSSGQSITATRVAAMSLVLLLTLGGAVPISSAQRSDPTPYGQLGNWNLVFRDEFNGIHGDGTGLDSSKWVTCYHYTQGDGTRGCGDDGAQSWYMPQNVVVSNGALHLITKRQSVVGTDGKTYSYSSGMVTTGRIGYSTGPKFSYVYGYAEVRAKVPGSKGFWPAFWSLVDGAAYSVRPLPEIDTLEILTRDPRTNNMTYHGPVTSPSGTYSPPSGQDFAQDWHIFASEWKPGEVVWYVDGVERYRFTDSRIELQLPMYLLLTMGVGSASSWAGAPDASTAFPSEFVIDYVRVWQRGPEGPPPANPAPPPLSQLNRKYAFPAMVVGAPVVLIRAGGGAYRDAVARVWSADTGFSGGSAFVSPNAIAGTTDPALYQGERYGDFAYSLAVPNGAYRVTLRFAEVWWKGRGQRVFHVTINGQPVLRSFDILSLVAPNTALDLTFPVNVTGGQIRVEFASVVEYAKVSAIEIVPAA